MAEFQAALYCVKEKRGELMKMPMRLMKPGEREGGGGANLYRLAYWGIWRRMCSSCMSGRYQMV